VRTRRFITHVKDTREPIYVGDEPPEGWEESQLTGGGPHDGVRVFNGLCPCGNGHLVRPGSSLRSLGDGFAYVLGDDRLYTFREGPGAEGDSIYAFGEDPDAADH